MSRSLHDASRSTRDKADVQTSSRTVHTVHVDLAVLLGQFDITDEVVLFLATPSGRDKRVAITGNFLAARNDGWAV